MYFKIFLLLAVMAYFNNTTKGRNAAIFWGVSIFLAGLITEGIELEVFIGSAISFVIALGVFKLLEYFDGNSFYWPAFIGGIAALILLA